MLVVSLNSSLPHGYIIRTASYIDPTLLDALLKKKTTRKVHRASKYLSYSGSLELTGRELIWRYLHDRDIAPLCSLAHHITVAAPRRPGVQGTKA